MIIDVHSHFLSREIFERLELFSMNGSIWALIYDSGVQCGKLPEKVCYEEERLKEMDASGIDKAVVYFPLVLPPHLSSYDIYKRVNDGTARFVKKYPDRIIGFAIVPMLEEKTATEELERASAMGLSGVKIPSSVEGLPLDSERFQFLYEKASELDMPIIVHPAGTPFRNKLTADFGLMFNAGWEFDLTIATFRIIFGGVLKDFPKLKFIVSHFGGAFPILKGRVTSSVRKNLAFWRNIEGKKLPAISIDDFDKYLEKIYFDAGGHHGWMNSFKSALLTLRKDRIVFGSDYPLEIQNSEGLKDYITNIRNLDIGEKDKQLILGTNASEVLNVK